MAEDASNTAVLHHATLPHRGGAVRVARLLALAQRQGGRNARLSFEFAENDPEALGGGAAESVLPLTDMLTGPTQPGDFAKILPPGAAAHLHTSTDWPALLRGLAERPPAGPVFLTLHDASPLTGGCAYPLDCPHFPVCAEACPRDFPAARALQAEIAALIRAVAPVVVSPSRWLAGLAKTVLPGLPVRVIPNGVPWPELADMPSRARARSLLGVAPGAPMALFAAHGGARAAYKSGPQWLELWRAVRPAAPGAVAFAVGGDEAGSQDGLTVWPYVDRTKLLLLMRAADVLLYPTLADNHPLVLLEAASAELAVAGFAAGGVPEIVVQGETGVLVPPEDGPGLVRAARALLADPAQCRRLGREARSFGGRRFAAGRMAADYARLMEVQAGRGAAGSRADK